MDTKQIIKELDLIIFAAQEVQDEARDDDNTDRDTIIMHAVNSLSVIQDIAATIRDALDQEPQTEKEKISKEQAINLYRATKVLLRWLIDGHCMGGNPYLTEPIRDTLRIVAEIQGEKSYLNACVR